jgi:hypothetical protein
MTSPSLMRELTVPGSDRVQAHSPAFRRGYVNPKGRGWGDGSVVSLAMLRNQDFYEQSIRA